jgi:hypothetical protein
VRELRIFCSINDLDSITASEMLFAKPVDVARFDRKYFANVPSGSVEPLIRAEEARFHGYLRSVPDSFARSSSKLRGTVKGNELAPVALYLLLETGQVLEFRYPKQRQVGSAVFISDLAPEVSFSKTHQCPTTTGKRAAIENLGTRKLIPCLQPAHRDRFGIGTGSRFVAFP